MSCTKEQASSSAKAVPDCASVSSSMNKNWLVLLIFFVALVAIALTIPFASRNKNANILSSPCAQQWRKLLGRYTIELRQYITALLQQEPAQVAQARRRKANVTENALVELYKSSTLNPYAANLFAQQLVQNTTQAERLSVLTPTPKNKTFVDEQRQRWKNQSIQLANLMGGLSADPSASVAAGTPMFSAGPSRNVLTRAAVLPLSPAQIVPLQANKELLVRWTLAMEQFIDYSMNKEYEAAQYAFEEAYVTSQQIADLWASVLCVNQEDLTV